MDDNGIGIPPEDQNRVFERFYRVDKSHSKDISGTGLGLSIVKHGAALHDGQIRLESTPGKGTTVTLLLPQGCAHKIEFPGKLFSWKASKKMKRADN